MRDRYEAGRWRKAAVRIGRDPVKGCTDESGAYEGAVCQRRHFRPVL